MYLSKEIRGEREKAKERREGGKERKLILFLPLSSNLYSREKEREGEREWERERKVKRRESTLGCTEWIG
jgi:hypothetical protein